MAGGPAAARQGSTALVFSDHSRYLRTLSGFQL
jgi:hypothetical protein